MNAGGDTIDNERREAVTERTEWAAPAPAEVSEGGGPAVAPRRPWWRRRAVLIVGAVLAGLLLLGGGFGIGFAAGNAVGSSSVTGFDPSQRGQMPDGGFGQGSGPGSQFQAPDGTDSGTGDTSGTATS